MKINNFALANMNRLLSNYAEKRLPQKISYAITKNLIILSKDVEVYEEMLKKLIESYKDHIEKDESGELKFHESGVPIIEDDEARANFETELNELLNIEIDVDFYKIDDELFNYDDSERYDSMSAIDILRLREMLC